MDLNKKFKDTNNELEIQINGLNKNFNESEKKYVAKCTEYETLEKKSSDEIILLRETISRLERDVKQTMYEKEVEFKKNVQLEDENLKNR